MKQLIVTIEPDGSTTVEAEGFRGRGCLDATKAIEAAVGVVVQRTKKAAFFAREEVRQDAKIGHADRG